MKQQKEDLLINFVQVVLVSQKKREWCFNVTLQSMEDMYTYVYQELTNDWSFLRLKFTLQVTQVR